MILKNVHILVKQTYNIRVLFMRYLNLSYENVRSDTIRERSEWHHMHWLHIFELSYLTFSLGCELCLSFQRLHQSLRQRGEFYQKSENTPFYSSFCRWTNVIYPFSILLRLRHTTTHCHVSNKQGSVSNPLPMQPTVENTTDLWLSFPPLNCKV